MLDRKQQKQQLVLIPAHCFCVAAGTDVEMQSLESVPAVPVHLLHTSTSDIWINVSAAFWNPNLSKTATSRVKTDMVFKRLFGDDWQELSSFLNKNNTERLKQNPWHAFSFSWALKVKCFDSILQVSDVLHFFHQTNPDEISFLTTSEKSGHSHIYLVTSSLARSVIDKSEDCVFDVDDKDGEFRTRS